MANNSQKSQNRGPSLSRAMHAKTGPITERAARWADALASESFTELDEMMRVPPGSGSIGGGSNSALQSLTKGGQIRRDKVFASPDGTALVTFKNHNGVVGCAYLQVSGRYITDAKIAAF